MDKLKLSCTWKDDRIAGAKHIVKVMQSLYFEKTLKLCGLKSEILFHILVGLSIVFLTFISSLTIRWHV